jgi:hypothetical protein
MTDARFTNNPEVPIQVELFGGVPSQMAVLTNMDFASAVWQPFSANFTLSLGPADGRYDIWVGLRALAQGSPTNWDSIAVNLDRVPPMMCLTSPLPNTTLSMPYIQVKGYTQKPIQHLEYDVTNSAGLNTFTGAFVAEQYYDTNCFCFTTNFFELVDVDLTNGPNTIFIRATDIAGNSATNSFSFTLDLAGDTVPPAVSIYWPQDGDILSGTNFTLRGLVDDPTAKLTVQVTNSSGSSNVLVALVERNGLFWAQDLPLGEGTNYLLVTATDAAGNLTTSNLTVLQSSVGLIIDDIPRERLWDWTITVTGAIESDGYTVWVNGVMATNNGDGTWVASEVPLNEGNTAVIQARAISNNDNGGNGTGGGTGARPTYQDSRNPSSPTAIQNEGGKGRQVRIYIEHHHQEWTYNRHTHYDFYVNDNGEPGERFDWVDLDWQEKAGHDWTDGKGGNGWWSRVQVDRSQGAEPATNDCHSTITWPPTLYPVVVPGVWTTNLGCIEPRFPELVPCISAEHCDINNNYDSENPPMLILDPWHPYYMQFVAATIHSDASRQADATVKVFTGDKDEKHPSRKSVLELFVPVAQITNGSLSCGGVGELPVPAAQVNVGEIGRPNADYTVYKVAERGKTLDATVTAPPKRFIWAVSGDMHDLAIQCVCDVPKERERTTVGVGEYVNMTFQPDFWLHPPLWGHTGGGLNVGPTIPANAVLYTASSNATSDSVMANFPAPGGKHVTLTTTFGVVAPDGVTTTVREFDWAGSLPLVGAGMKLDVVLQPTTVSFSRVEVMEPGEPTTGITGYFSNHPPPTHAGNGADVWHPVNCGNLIMGPPIDAFDHANSYGWPVGQWGTYTWPIHPIWRVPGTGTTHTLSGWTDQVHTLQVDGTVIVQKFGHTVTRGPNEPRGSGQ